MLVVLSVGCRPLIDERLHAAAVTPACVVTVRRAGLLHVPRELVWAGDA